MHVYMPEYARLVPIRREEQQVSWLHGMQSGGGRGGRETEVDNADALVLVCCLRFCCCR